MMLKIEVKSADVNVKSGNSRNGKPYEIREQSAYWHKDGKPYPVEIKLTLEDGKAPFEPGFYTVSSDSFYVGKYRDLQIGRLKLVSAGARRVA